MSPRVIFFTNSLDGGGAESHALRVMNHLDRGRYLPVLAVAKRGGCYEDLLARDVEVHGVSFGRIPSSTTRVALSPLGIRALARRLEPAIVCSLMDVPNLASLAAVRSLGARRPRAVVCVQIPPSIEYSRSRFGRRVVIPAVRRAYVLADRIIALSHGVRADLTGLNPALAERITVIHNACVDDRLLMRDADRNQEMPQTSRPVILAAGRLSYQKGYPHLLDAFAQVRRDADAELWILGDGPDRTALEAQIARLGLQDSVRLLGFQRSPQAFMRRATVFVLSSLYEGFGNVIVEALACGAPVVATNCPYGPSEILETERSGLLVPVADPTRLAQALLRVVRDDSLRARLVAEGTARAQAFHAKVIADAYADEFDRVMQRA